MDNYGSRGNGSKYQMMNKNQKSSYRRSHDDEMYSERDRNDDYYSKKSKKPEQNYYQTKQQQQQPQIQGNKSDSSKRYEARQTSEPRITMSNNNNFAYNPDSEKSNFDRNRDQQNYEHRNKPPSGPRINNAAFRNLPMNIDTLPPRLKRKYLKECGLPEELADNGKPIMELAQSSYSNTLPYGNRNRYDQQQHRYDQHQYHQQNFQNNNYQSKYNNQNHNFHHRSRSITPPRQQHQKQHHTTPKNEWKSPNEKQQNEDVMRNKTEKDGQSSFDWSEDVMNSHSLPPDVNSPSSGHKYDDNNRHRHRRRRNRSASSNGSVERAAYNPSDNNFQNVFKMPFPKSGNNRQRRNSQSSYNSRENSMEDV